ncbi:hypothetical protein FQN60_011287 [Etheostoma spectabile]|uniref:Uncharacterized protein n=1 Tax=Etheostoma spectabile TaxID=54343 RepID=A0A5J5DRN8_9PERO|nr:hypothetical protein FQN60_011287 [Etheostoma spectabile]
MEAFWSVAYPVLELGNVGQGLFQGSPPEWSAVGRLRVLALFSLFFRPQLRKDGFLPIGRKESMAYHWWVAVHDADHLDVNPFLIHILQQPHHIAHAHPFAICVAHGNNPAEDENTSPVLGCREENVPQEGDHRPVTSLLGHFHQGRELVSDPRQCSLLKQALLSLSKHHPNQHTEHGWAHVVAGSVGRDGLLQASYCLSVTTGTNLRVEGGHVEEDTGFLHSDLKGLFEFFWVYELWSCSLLTDGKQVQLVIRAEDLEPDRYLLLLIISLNPKPPPTESSTMLIQKLSVGPQNTRVTLARPTKPCCKRKEKGEEKSWADNVPLDGSDKKKKTPALILICLMICWFTLARLF